MDSLFFTSDERLFFERVIEDGLLQNRRGVYWWVVRFAVAQSLKMDDVPDERFKAVGGAGRSELHLEQVTGQGQTKMPDYDEAMRLMLSVKHGIDLVGDEKRYVDMLQRHARRGLNILAAAWTSGRSFHDFLLDDLFLDANLALTHDDEDRAHVVTDGAMLMQGLKQIGVSATLAADPIDGPRLTRFALTLATVDDYDRARKRLDDLAFAIGLGNSGIVLKREAKERRVTLDIPRPSGTWKDISWSAIRPSLSGRQELLAVCPGVDSQGQAFVFDLAEAPHLFVAGATGSGKSMCLNAILLSLLAARRPPELLMIDPKGVDFADYNGWSKLRDRSVITDMSLAVEKLRGLVDEMESRQEVLRELGVRNIAEAQQTGSPLERLVVVIDELSDFMMGRSGAEEPLIRLAQKARAVGIHLLLGTQRPEAATFPGLLRANIPSRIALTVQKSADSRIILDEGGAENLLMRGDMLIKLAGKDVVRVHGARVEAADVKKAMTRT